MSPLSQRLLRPVVHPLRASLQSKAVASWKLEEASGSRVDKKGGHTLTDNNTVTQADGKVGKAASFAAASSEYLSITDNAALSGGDRSFTIAAWLYTESQAAAMEAVTKWHPTGNQREYALEYLDSSDRLRFLITQDGSTQVVATASNFGAVPNQTWMFVVAWHDATANTINIQVNNGTANSTAHTTGVLDGTADFVIGALGNASTFWNGRIDEVTFFNAVLTAAEKTWLYNAGNGRGLF